MSVYPCPGSFDDQILHQLRSGRKMSVLDAVREFGIPTLRESICRLRKHGYQIADEWQPCVGDAHRPRKFKVYFLEPATNANFPGGKP